MKIPILPALFLCTLASAPALRAQSAKQVWVMNVNAHGFGRAVVVDGNGNVAVTGDRYITKYAAADGRLLWEKISNGGLSDMWKVAVDASGNVIATGSSSHLFAYGWRSDFYTAKYAEADGTLLWEKHYNGTGNDNDYATSVALDASGNVIVTGTSVGIGGNGDCYTAKYAAVDGALLWENRYNGPENGNDFANSVAVDSHGNVLIVGGSFHGNGLIQFYTAKYAAVDGSLLWVKRYDGLPNSINIGSGVAVDGAGNVVVTGVSSDGAEGRDFYTAKYAAEDAALLWEKRYNGPNNDYDAPIALAVDNAGNVIVTGVSDMDLWTSTGGDFYTAKYASADGALLWEKRYHGPGTGSDQARALALDASGNVVVTGYSGYVYASASGDCYTAKYAAADGALLWEAIYNGPTDNSDSAYSVAVTADGGAVITGSSSNGSFFNVGYMTVRYAPPNLIDYAFGLDPASGSPQLPPWAVSNGTISTTFTQPPGVTGITYGAEWTTDLAVHPWIHIPDTGTGGTHTFSVPIGPDPRKFFRFTVSQP